MATKSKFLSTVSGTLVIIDDAEDLTQNDALINWFQATDAPDEVKLNHLNVVRDKMDVSYNIDAATSVKFESALAYCVNRFITGGQVDSEVIVGSINTTFTDTRED